MFVLLDELKKIVPYDKNENDDKLKTIKFLEENINCFSRSNLAGHINAGGLVINDKHQILLNHHKVLDVWFQFGGHSDGNPDSLEVAKREILEEAGLNDLELVSEGIFDVCINQIDYNEKKHEPEHYHYDINFLFKTKQDKFKISSESKEIKWVTIDEAYKLISPDDVSMKRMLDKYKKLLDQKS